MSNKTKRILKLAPSILIAIVIVMSSVFKLSDFQPIVQRFAEIGILQYLKVCALMELLFIVLFLNPRTIRVGLMLLTAYFGGAIAVELVSGGTAIPPAIILSVVWLAAYIRKPGLFFEQPTTVSDQLSVSNRRSASQLV